VKTILFDIDHTLIDTNLLRVYIADRIIKMGLGIHLERSLVRKKSQETSSRRNNC